MKTFLFTFSAVLFLGLSSFNGDKKNKDKSSETHAAANTSISGVILDHNTGETLTGVEIKLNGNQAKTYTNFEGKFNFNGLKPGNYKVEASFISYQPLVSPNIKVESNEFHALNLNLESVSE